MNLVSYSSPVYGGPYGIDALLLPPQLATPIYEGPWVPIIGAKVGSLELTGSMSTLSLDFYGTNDPGAQNGYTITIGGTITDADTLTATFSNPNLPNGTLTKTITVTGSDTTSTLSAALAAAINADTMLQGLGIRAAALVAVVTVSFPSIMPGTGSAAGGLAGNYTGLGVGKSGGASETIVAATLTTGTKIGSSLTAFGFTALTVFPAMVKARLQTLTGTNANVTAALAAAT